MRKMRRWSVTGAAALIVSAGAASQAQDAPLTAAPIVASQDTTSVQATAGGLYDLHVRETPIATVLEMLSYQAKSNIVSTASVTGKVSANLYGVTLDAALDAILLPNQLSYRRIGNVVHVGTVEEIAAQLPVVSKVIVLKYLPVGDAQRIAQGLVSKTGKITASHAASGGGGGAGGAEGGAASPFGLASAAGKGGDEFRGAGVDCLIVTDAADRVEAVERLLRQIDARPKQVLIEATILRATLNENNKMGIDMTLLSGVDFQNVSSTSDASQNLRTGALPADQLQETTFNVNSNLIGNSFNDGGFTFGIIHNNVAAFIRALEAITDVTVLANPKVVALNRQEAEVIVGRRDGYLTTTVTQTAAIQSVEFLETGTQIHLRPVINDDGTVRLEVTPKDSNGGLTAANLPFEETTEARAQLLVDDGRTVMIGGLFRERTVASRSQIPGVGDIPGVGLLFQKTVNETVREEVIILLTVHVLKDTPEEQRAFERLLADIERVRAGSRRGLMCTGRDRLAQAFYEDALERVDDGDLGCALLSARCALHNAPRHIGALKLEERLTERRLWEGEATRIRAFTRELIEAERDQRRERGVLGEPPTHKAVIDESPLPTLDDAADPASGDGENEDDDDRSIR